MGLDGGGEDLCLVGGDGVGLVLGGGVVVALGGVRAPDEVQIVLLPFSCAAILVPAKHSTSRNFVRFCTTLALRRVVPHMAPSTIHCTVSDTVPRMRSL